MDDYQKQLLNVLKSRGGTADNATVRDSAYFPNNYLAEASRALIDSGLIDVDYPGNNPGYEWSVARLTAAGWAAAD